MGNAREYDLIIKNGIIVDGTKKEAYKGEVGIKDNKIITITEKFDEDVKSKKTIDAKGNYITPGFVDIHTHIDLGNLMKTKCLSYDRYAENFTRQGVTTVLGGMCGYSRVQIGEFLELLNEGKTGPNAAVLIGHGMVRMAAMGGIVDKAPSEEEMQTMKFLVKKAMEEGSFGLSSGLGYTPGNYAKPEEIIELCKIVKEYNGIYSTHIRNQDRNVIDCWKEAIEVGRQSGVHVHIAHTQIIGQECWGQAKVLTDMIAKANEEGIKVTCDAFPYEGAGVSLTSAVVPPWALAGTKDKSSEESLLERLNDEELLPKLKEEMKDLMGLRGTAEGILLLNSVDKPEKDKEIKGKYLSDLAKEWDLEPIDAVIKLLKGYGSIMLTCFQSSADDKLDFYKSEYCSVASDAFCQLYDRIAGVDCQPREYGTFPRFIQDYVKENNKFTIEEAIYKMTNLPAQTVGFENIGTIEEGKNADIVILNINTLSDNATYGNGHVFPTGIETVIINGKVAVLDENHQRILSGVAIAK